VISVTNERVIRDAVSIVISDYSVAKGHISRILYKWCFL